MGSGTNSHVAIIGAGVGGLAAGIYAQLHGLKATIYEMHVIPGGMCTSWRRKGYTIDGSIHHLAGCRKGTLLNKLWRRLGVFPAKTIFPDDLVSVEDESGNNFTVWTDLDRLEEEFRERIVEEDREIVDRYLRSLRKYQSLDLLEMSLWKTSDWILNLPKLLTASKLLRVDMKGQSDQFKTPFLKKAFRTFQYDWEEIPLMVHINMLANCSMENFGWYEGGSNTFSRAMEKRFKDLGGTIHYRTPVTEILTEGNRAVGIKLKNGDKVHADHVISNSFLRKTHRDLLKDRFLTEKDKQRFSKLEDNMVMGIHVSLGVKMNLTREPHAFVLFLNHPIMIAGRKLERIGVEQYSFDPSLAPPGSTVVKVLYNTSYKFWKNMTKERYNREKKEIASTTISALEKRFPGIRESIEMIDVATPLTTERYTNNGQGSSQDEISGSDMVRMMLSKPVRVKGLKNVYIIGQSAGGAGIPGCAVSGAKAVKSICRSESLKFKI